MPKVSLAALSAVTPASLKQEPTLQSPTMLALALAQAKLGSHFWELVLAIGINLLALPTKTHTLQTIKPILHSLPALNALIHGLQDQTAENARVDTETVNSSLTLQIKYAQILDTA